MKSTWLEQLEANSAFIFLFFWLLANLIKVICLSPTFLDLWPLLEISGDLNIKKPWSRLYCLSWGRASIVTNAVGRRRRMHFSLANEKADKGAAACLSTLCLRGILFILLHHPAALLNNFCRARSARAVSSAYFLVSATLTEHQLHREIKNQFRGLIWRFKDTFSVFSRLPDVS